MTDIDFPSGLPTPLRQGYGLNHVSPFARTQMASGRSRSRRTFTSVPSNVPVSWLFTEAETQAFEAWFRDVINDGTDRFNCKIKSPLGIKPYECEFNEMYEIALVGLNYWRVTAELQITERPILPPGWGQFPDLILGSSIIDVALNREWPEA